jgi:hypothetical protein
VADFVVGGIQRTVMPPVRVHGKLGEPLRTDMVPSFKLRDALLEFFDLVPAPPPKHDKEGRE